MGLSLSFSFFWRRRRKKNSTTHHAFTDRQFPGSSIWLDGAMKEENDFLMWAYVNNYNSPKDLLQMSKNQLRWRRLSFRSDDDRASFDTWVVDYLKEETAREKMSALAEWGDLMKILCIGFISFAVTHLGVRANALIHYDLCSLESHCGHSTYASFQVTKPWTAVIRNGEVALGLLHVDELKENRNVILKSFEWYACLGSWRPSGSHSVFEGPMTGQRIGRMLIARFLDDYKRDKVKQLLSRNCFPPRQKTREAEKFFRFTYSLLTLAHIHDIDSSMV